MKTLTNLKMYVVVICVLMITSCEKSEEIEVLEASETTEGFMSITGKSDTEIEEGEIVITPLLHRRYSADLSEEQALAKFELAVSEYARKNPINQEKGVSTEWFYRIGTYTGTQNDNETDGDVKAGIKFRTSKGTFWHRNVYLNKSGDDREGGWDYYLNLASASYSGQGVEWVEIDAANIKLKGTDGWFLKTFTVYMYPAYQNVPATGGTRVNAYPNVWLDNNYFWGWDTYSTGELGTGRLNF